MYGLRHLVVDFENQALRAVLAMCLFVVLADDRERVHCVVGVVAREAIQAEEGGIELTAEKTPACWLPAKGWAVVADIACKAL